MAWPTTPILDGEIEAQGMEGTLPIWLEPESASQDPGTPDSFGQPRGFVDPMHSDATSANRTMAVSIIRKPEKHLCAEAVPLHILSTVDSTLLEGDKHTELNLHSQWLSDQWTDSQLPDL